MAGLFSKCLKVSGLKILRILKVPKRFLTTEQKMNTLAAQGKWSKDLEI